MRRNQKSSRRIKNGNNRFIETVDGYPNLRFPTFLVLSYAYVYKVLGSFPFFACLISIREVLLILTPIISVEWNVLQECSSCNKLKKAQ